MVALEPRVNEEKLRELLAFGAESPMLDFKETCDLRETRDRVELAKDIGAMQVDGGYIVVGADSNGVLTGRLTEEQAALFDEARLRQILAKWLPAPFDLLAAVHQLEGMLAAVVYVAPNPKGMCIFKADGQYQDSSARTVTVFERATCSCATARSHVAGNNQTSTGSSTRSVTRRRSDGARSSLTTFEIYCSRAVRHRPLRALPPRLSRGNSTRTRSSA